MEFIHIKRIETNRIKVAKGTARNLFRIKSEDCRFVGLLLQVLCFSNKQKKSSPLSRKILPDGLYRIGRGGDFPPSQHLEMAE